MDRLSSNHIVIDYGWHKVIFLEIEGLELILTQKALKEMEVGATCFMIVAQAEKKSTIEQIRSIPMVDKYVNFFPNEVLGLSPSRDVNFTIDIIPEASPVSVTPYRMAPVELVELKKKMEDLLEKKFIQLSSSPWGV